MCYLEKRAGLHVYEQEYFNVCYFSPVFSVSFHSQDRYKFLSFLSLSQQDIIGKMTDWCELK